MKDCKHKSVQIIGKNKVKCQWCNKEMPDMEWFKFRKAVQNPILRKRSKVVS